MEGVCIRQVDHALLKATSADQPASGCGAVGLCGRQAKCLQRVGCISSLHDEPCAAVGTRQHGCGAGLHTGPYMLLALPGSPARLKRSWQRLQAQHSSTLAHPQAPQPCLPVQLMPQGASRPRLQEAPTRLTKPRAHICQQLHWQQKLCLAGLSPGCRIGALHHRTRWLDQQGP